MIKDTLKISSVLTKSTQRAKHLNLPKENDVFNTDWHLEILEERMNKKNNVYYTHEEVLERLKKLESQLHV